MASTYDMLIQRGNSFFFQITTANDDGAPINLSGYNVSGYIKLKYSDTDILLDLSPSIVNATSGQININLTSAQTSILPITEAIYNVNLISGNYSSGILQGYCQILPNVLY